MILLKAKLLSRELQLCQEATDHQGNETKQVNQELNDLKKAVKHKDWEIQDINAVKDAR